MKQSVLSLPQEVASLPYITSEEIIPHQLLSHFHNPFAGAVVLFSGDVRNHNKGKDVLYLEYEAHKEMAEKMINDILEQAKNQWDLVSAFCQHRVGRIDPSACAVIVITVSKHRKEAYEANRFIIDNVKKDVPIWKKEYFKDAPPEWTANDISAE